jgi:gliding motility-associated-like protein
LFTGLDSGDGYLIKVQEDSLCVRPHPEPVAVAQPEPIVINYRLRSPTCLGCSDGQIIVRDISGGTPPYRLTLDGKDQENTMTGLAEGTYLLTAYDSRTCSAALELTIDMNLVVPNVITPNGDNINDLWIIPLLNYYPEGDIRLFNSAGQLVREITFTDGYNKDPWNGKDETDQLVPVGTYYYIIRYNDEVDGPMQLTGYVMVLK